MCLDSKKFLITTDGKEIRLFPENYRILSRERTKLWKLDIDPEVPKALALLIFGEYHTNTLLRTGRKEPALEALNSLLCEESLPSNYGAEWELDEVLGRYHIWARNNIEGKDVFQATSTNAPPTSGAGYYDRDALLRDRGIVPYLQTQ